MIRWNSLAAWKMLFALALMLASVSDAQAQSRLTGAQLSALKTEILADATLKDIPNTPDGAFAIADVLNKSAAPSFWVWKTTITHNEIVTNTSLDGTNWSWTDFIARSAAERDGWRQMFSDGGRVNPALANVRQGFADIFSGAAGANQRTHLLAIGRRTATRSEKLFAAGTGSTASPATMAFEGSLNYIDVLAARNLP